MRKISLIILILSLSLTLIPAQAQQTGGDQQAGQSPVVLPELYNRAAAAANNGDFDRAILDYSTFLLLNPTFGQGFFGRALAYQAKGEASMALQDMNRALSYNSPSPQFTATVYFNRANIYMAQDNITAAMNDLDASLDANPDNIDSRLMRAQLLISQERYSDALPDFDALVERQPEETNHYLGRAYAHAQLGELNAALNDYTQAIEVAPDNPQVYVERALFYASLREFDEALGDINQAIDLAPENSGFYLLRGSLNTATNNAGEAAADYLEWLRLNGSQHFVAPETITDSREFLIEMGPGRIYSIPFSVEAGQVISAAATSMVENPPVDPLLVITGTDGTPLIANDNSGGSMNAAITGYTLPEDGEYTLVVGHAAGSTEAQGEIRVSITFEAD